MSRIAFIGLGNMGGPMAANLVKNGHTVRVFDLVPAAVQAAVDAGASAAASARETLADAEVVISMLPASRHVEGVYLGDDGILAAIPAGALVIDCSTIAPASARKVSEAAAARGLQMIDAPVSGGTAGAQAGTTGAHMEDVLAHCLQHRAGALQRILLATDDEGQGAGQVAKLCNNMALGVIMAVTGEAIALGVAHGLDPKVLSQMMAVSTGRSWATEVCNPWPGVLENAPASRGYSGGFGSDLMLKDMGLAVEAAMSVGASIPLGEVARNLYSMNHQAGRGKLDFSSVVQLITSEK